jgi:hypothetical protein
MEDQVSDEKKSINEWIDFYMQNGTVLNGNTIRKRRMVSGIGTLVQPKTYMLTREEFDQVLNTPLPFCRSVINTPRS